MKILIYGLVTGIIFGFLMQRARVIRFDKQVGALLLKDLTIVKFMFTAILVGMVGIYLLNDMAVITAAGRPLMLGAVVIGGALFGLGWALLGYCPGTAWGALGEGRLDALAGILGLFAGAGLYASTYPLLADSILGWGDLGSITIPEALHINHWLVIGVFVAGGILLFRWIEGMESKKEVGLR